MESGNRLGERIKALRLAKAWSQEHLVEVCDVDGRTIRRIESGRNIPSLETFQALAGALDVEVGELQALLKPTPQPKKRHVTIIPIPDGRTLFAVLAGACAGRVHADDIGNEEEAGLVADLLDRMEYAEIWDDIDPRTRYAEEQTASDIIRQLEAMHWAVCASRRIDTLRLTPPTGELKKCEIPAWITVTLRIAKIEPALIEAFNQAMAELRGDAGVVKTVH